MKKQEKIIWLSGLIDGEGCIYAKLTQGKHVVTQIQIHAASEIMIDAVEEIYNEQNIHYIREKPFRQKLSTKDTHRITVHKKEHVLNLLLLLQPYLVVKLKEALHVIEYIQKYPKYSSNPDMSERQVYINKLKGLKRI